MFGTGEIGLIFGKSEVAGLCVFCRRKIFQGGGIVSNHLTTNMFCNFQML